MFLLMFIKVAQILYYNPIHKFYIKSERDGFFFFFSKEVYWVFICNMNPTKTSRH